jgi:HD superfamily phosphohydrolase
MTRPQRIRDPLHNLIEFDAREFEQTCWKVLNTRPMQRLRRIKQLGFSEFTYPGASHSRFAHSVGVFHTARQLVGVVHKRLGDDRFDPDEARLAMAAALVHDIGHGPFSHAFEGALKRLGIAKRHELRTKQILEQTDVIEAFDEFPEFPKRIGDLIEAQYPKTIYASLVSSQFDADRLDYMRRDKLMSGTQQSGIDFDWLIANLQVRKVPIQVDGETVGKTEVLVIDDKSIIAAEGYIFSLLYLYMNVYFHKTTRGFEKIFSLLIELLAKRVRDGQHDAVGLPKNHPLVRFLLNPEEIEPFLQLDDAVVLGSLSMLAEGSDKSVAEMACRIRDRKIYRCVDVSKKMSAAFGLPREGSADSEDVRNRAANVAERVARVGELVKERGLLAPGEDGLPGILEDTAPRSPYEKVSDGAQSLKRILVIGADGQLHDLADMSSAVSALGDFRAYRLYTRTDSDREKIDRVIEDASQ